MKNELLRARVNAAAYKCAELAIRIRESDIGSLEAHRVADLISDDLMEIAEVIPLDDENGRES